MSKKEYIVLQPKKTIVDVEYSDGTVARTESRFWYEGEVAHLKFFVDDNKQIAELKTQLAEKDEELNSARVGEQFALKCCSEAKKQLAEKDKELKQKNKTIKKYIRYNDELANALVEKPKQEELYQLREDNKILTMKRDNFVNAKLKEQRHQICEKIRKTFEDEIIKQKIFYGVDDIKLHFANLGNLLCEFDWKKILDQIKNDEKEE